MCFFIQQVLTYWYNTKKEIDLCDKFVIDFTTSVKKSASTTDTHCILAPRGGGLQMWPAVLIFTT